MSENPLLKTKNKKEDNNSKFSKVYNNQEFKDKYVLEIEIGDLKFSNLNGDIISRPKPYLLQSTTRGSKFKCLLNDTKGDLREKISEYKKATINIGFAASKSNKVIIPQIEGLIWEVSRKPPNSVILIVTDIKLELKQDQGVSLGNTKNESEKSEDNTSDSSTNNLSSILDFVESTLTNSGDEVKDRNKFLTNLLDDQKSESEPLYSLFTNSEENNYSFESSVKIKSKQGFIKTQRSDLQEITQNALFQGDKVFTDFNTIKQVNSSNRRKSLIRLDYINKRYAFVSDPEIGKRSPINRRSGQGTVTVKGWSVNNKGTVGATAVSAKDAGKPSSEILDVPEWGEINLKDKIIEELPFTWSDATKNGSRVPGGAEIEQIIRISKAIIPIFEASDKNWTITSWYRPRAVNRSVGGAANSKHIEGHAIDFAFPGVNAFFRSQIEGKWDGGHALKSGSFIHLDLGSKRTWSY